MTHKYVTANQLLQLDLSISTRDRQILDVLAKTRIASSEQLERLCCHDITRRRARQILKRLTERRLLERLPRTIGGVRAGSGRYVYSLGVAGSRLMTGNGRVRDWSIGQMFLNHALMITELYTRLVEAHAAGELVLTSFQGEPASWRWFSGPGGARTGLKPDAAVSVRFGRYEDRWYLEVDNGTESMPTITRKCEVYRRYWQTGKEQAKTGVFPRVLWVVPDEKRKEKVASACAKVGAEYWPLFAVATRDEAVERIARGAHV